MLALDAAEPVACSRDAIAAAVEIIRPTGPLLLVAIDPQGVHEPVGRTFAQPEAREAAVTWAADLNEQGRNLHFTPNLSRTSVHKKAAKGDMTDGLWVWTDADPAVLAFGGYARAREHLLRSLFPELTRTASLVIDSGNGLQALWRLKLPIGLGDPARRDQYEELNKLVGEAFDGPGTQNCDRVLRLPGTINYPTASKLKKGYPAEPRQARLLHVDEVTYTPGEIQGVLLRRRFDVLLGNNRSARLRYDGHADGLADASGSGRDMSMVRMLKVGGFTLDEIVQLLKDWPHGSSFGRSQGIRYWQRMWDKPTDDSVPPPREPYARSEPPRDPSRLRPLTLDELLAQPAPGWLVRGVLIKTGLALIYGQPGSGKSFLALDLCGSILRGVPWYGHRVSRGNVIYIAGEGHLRNRLRAYLAQHGLVPADLAGLRIINSSLNLRDPRGDLLPLLEELQGAAAGMGGVSLVVIDTLNSVMGGGDENESSDMGAMIEAARRIGDACQSAVMYVHHSGKDEARGARGHSSLKGALDTELHVRREEEKRIVTLSKVKEGEDGKEYQFDLQPIDLGPATDPEATPDERESSCAVIQVIDQPILPPPPKARAGRPKSGSTQLALDTLRAVLHDHGEALPATSSIPPGKQGVRVDSWRSRFYGTDPGCGDPAVSQAARLKRFTRAHDELYAAGKIGQSGGFVWLA